MYKIIILTIVFLSSLLANNKTYVVENNTYKIINFEKRIVDIRFSNSDNLSVIFMEDKKNPFSQIKIFAKKIGKTNAVVVFSDKTTMHIDFKVILDIRDIRLLVNEMAKDVKLVQINNTIVLKGNIKNNKIKAKVVTLITDTIEGIKIIDLLKLEEPDKMVRLKLYVAEINNNDGETIKNNWSMGGFNDGKTSLDVSANMLNAVTLSGGLALNANRLGSKFNTGLTLNYLKSNGVAKILDETTLVTLENKSSNFLAGGTLLIETSNVNADGMPITAITELNYGLQLNIIVKEIINNKYISIEIDTSSSSLDAANGVGNMPAKKDKSIKTKVIIEDKSTIVLGGLINNTNSKDWDKVPLLGDIPVLGLLFQSKAFREGNSELIFFITPTIIDTTSNNQEDEYKEIKEKIKAKPKVTVVNKIKDEEVIDKKDLSNQELHNQRLKLIFGI